MEFKDVMAQRQSVKNFDPNHEVTDDRLQQLFSVVELSPSSFNLQHWRFIAVRDLDTKKKLRQASWNQEQVEHASVVIIVAGKLNAHEDAERIFSDVPEKVRQTMVPMIHGFYADKPTMQRDEAVRSASIASMSLMLAAQDMGYATGPLIGFDPVKISELVALDQHHIPVMMIVLGKAVGETRPRASRLPLSEIVKLEFLNGTGLA